MAKPMKRRPAAPSQHRYPREARLNQSLRQVIAEELVAIDDEHLDLVTITSIDVDPEMNRATVFFDSLRGEDGDPDILEALTRHRVRLQSSVARQIRSKKTPILTFVPDEVIRSAERIEKILRANPSPAKHELVGAEVIDGIIADVAGVSEDDDDAAGTDPAGRPSPDRDYPERRMTGADGAS